MKVISIITLLGTNISQGLSAWYQLLENLSPVFWTSPNLNCQMPNMTESWRFPRFPHFGKSSVEIHVAWGWMIFCFFSDACFFGFRRKNASVICLIFVSHLCRNTIRFSWSTRKHCVTHQVFIARNCLSFIQDAMICTAALQMKKTGTSTARSRSDRLGADRLWQTKVRKYLSGFHAWLLWLAHKDIQ